MEEDKIICKKCNGRGEYRVRFYYKNKHFYYYSKCGHCYARGYLDWIEVARGRKPGIQGYLIDSHAAGSLSIIGESIKVKVHGILVSARGNFIYDGHNYIDAKTERGSALWNHFISRKE
jgi:hypothetical protein